MERCPRCELGDKVTSSLWLPRAFAGITEVVGAPIALIKNTWGLMAHSFVRGIPQAKEVYYCDRCEKYFYRCAECYRRSRLLSFPRQGQVVECEKCNKKSILQLS